MHKLMISIEQIENEIAFDAAWPQFLFLAERMPGLRREATTRIFKQVFGSYPYMLVHELFFDSLEDMGAAMSSNEGREAGKMLQAITQGKVAICFADHREDDMKNISRYRSQSENE